METIPAKQILSAYREQPQWFGTHYTMNLYRGCHHGCIYCDSRSDVYQVKDFDTVRAKANAIDLLSKELLGKRKKGIIGAGAMSDPYNAFEREYELTRQALKLIDHYHFGIAIATKSDLIVRDADLLASIARHSPVLCKMTVTAADDALSRILEPHVAVSSKRFEAIRQLSSQGIFTGVLMMPILPFIEDTDENILEIVRLSKESGARFIYPAFGVTLRQNQRDYFYQALDRLFPGMTKRYIETFGDAYGCHSPRADVLKALFERACDEAGLLYKMPDIIAGYQKPDTSEQLRLFD